jgi:hypothetical protein
MSVLWRSTYLFQIISIICVLHTYFTITIHFVINIKEFRLGRIFSEGVEGGRSGIEMDENPFCTYWPLSATNQDALGLPDSHAAQYTQFTQQDTVCSSLM